jgi:hypothetical protein
MKRTNLSALVAVLLPIAACTPEDVSQTGDATTPVATCEIEPGELAITELFTNPVGADDGLEWFEVRNRTDRKLALAGLVIQIGSGTKPKAHPIPAVLDPGIEPGALFVFGNGVMGEGSFVGYSWPDMTLANTSGLIALLCGDTEIDRVAWGSEAQGPAAPGEGRSMQLTASIADSLKPFSPGDNDDPAVWCEAKSDAVFDAAGSLGTPGKANAACPVAGQCSEGGVYRAPVAPAAGSIVVTEVFPNPTGADSDHLWEWVELHALAAFDLNGVVLDHSNGSNSRTFTVASDACVPVAAGQYVVLAGTSDPALNGGLPAATVAVTKKLDLYNSDCTLTIRDAAGLEVAKAAHPAAQDGTSVALKPEAKDDPAAAADPANWCDATTTGVFEGTGTPGQENAACAAE